MIDSYDPLVAIAEFGLSEPYVVPDPFDVERLYRGGLTDLGSILASLFADGRAHRVEQR